MRVEEMVGQRIATLRERAGMTQAEFGRNLGEVLEKPWPRQTVSMAEKGGRKLTATELYAISLVLDTYVGRLFIPPPDLDVLEFPGGFTVAGDKLRWITAQPIDAQNILPAVALEIRDIAQRTRQRLGEDTATAKSLEKFYERLINSMVGEPSEPTDDEEPQP